MSDLDDIRKLDELLAAGSITDIEYANEKAWILGSAATANAADADKAAQAASTRASSGSHVIDLHEIEENETPASSKAGASGKSAREQARQARSDANERRGLPTVWKVILIAFLVWILLIASAVVFLRIRYAGAQTQQTSQVSIGAQTQAGSEAAQSAAQEIQDTTAEATYETFVTQLETTLGTYYGTNYTITDDGKTLTISLMGEGIAADAMYVVQGADGAAEIWGTLKDSMRTLAVTCFDGANARAAERHVVLNILNDQNQENVILSYLDGTCIYDATETTDLSE